MLTDDGYTRNDAEAATIATEHENPTPQLHHLGWGRLAMKTLTYRIVSTVSVIATTWLFSGQLELALEVGIFGALIRAIPYALHEWAWSRVGNKRQSFSKGKNDPNRTS